ncbi:MAG: hypothetical protein L0Z62_25260 [Gemmataceae bacterium]|nr:hypothetical protein [Gemmataceae bacterium]
MAKKGKHKRQAPAPLSPAVMKARAEKALNESRTAQALELARSLFKQDPAPPHKALLQRACLERARQLRAQGQEREARVVLDNAVQLGGEAPYLGQLAQELAASGEIARALTLVQGIPGSPALGKVLGHAADIALRRGPAGRDTLPEALRPQLDMILQAFAHTEAGRDEEARAALQGVGLQSPFLEWKVFLRGLMAYYQNDDLRALENWQRLNAERLPARLAAPLRFLIDPPYRIAQPPAAQALLQQQADKLQGSGLVPALRSIQRAVNHENKLADAFRQAEALMPALKREAPQLVSRLAACFYWAIIDHGQPEDMKRYLRVFGKPADDPQLARLEALAMEHRHSMPEAHKQWQRFEQSVAANPAAWPDGQANRVRALVWRRMAENADNVPDLDELADLPPFLLNHPDRPRPLKPSAEECLKRSLELAPDQLETHFALFEHYQRKEQRPRAEKAARELLKRFPDHAPTLEGLADLLMARQEYAEALELFQRALKANPLERQLRMKVGTAHSYKARQDAESGRFDEARAGYQAALAFDEGNRNYPVLCKWSACEFKAGNPTRAEELLAQAHSGEGNRLAVAYSMLIEVIRFKLPKALKDRFDREVKEELASPPSAHAAAAIADTASALQRAGVSYYGQKTHEKKVIAYLEKAIGLDFSEDQLHRVCASLGVLKAVRLHRRYLQRAQALFPQSPVFFLLEAQYNLSLGPHRCPIYETQQLLEKARRLAEALPRDPRQQELLDVIQRALDAVQALNPFARMFGGMFPMDMFDPFGFGPDEEEDY